MVMGSKLRTARGEFGVGYKPSFGDQDSEMSLPSFGDYQSITPHRSDLEMVTSLSSCFEVGNKPPWP